MVGHLRSQIGLMVNDLGALRIYELWHEHRYDTQRELSAQSGDGPEMMRVLQSGWTGAGIEPTLWFGNDSLLHLNLVGQELRSKPICVSRRGVRDHAVASSAPLEHRFPRRPILPPPHGAPCGDWIAHSIARVRWIRGKNRMPRREKRTVVMRAPWETLSALSNVRSALSRVDNNSISNIYKRTFSAVRDHRSGAWRFAW
jgi:hypothetical protein